jgi:hypothetical protein
LTRSRAKDGKSVVIIGDTDAIQTAVGSAVWEALLAEATTTTTTTRDMSHMTAAHITAAAHVAMAAHDTTTMHDDDKGRPRRCDCIIWAMVCFFLFDSLFIIFLTNVF